MLRGISNPSLFFNLETLDASSSGGGVCIGRGSASSHDVVMMRYGGSGGSSKPQLPGAIVQQSATVERRDDRFVLSPLDAGAGGAHARRECRRHWRKLRQGEAWTLEHGDRLALGALDASGTGRHDALVFEFVDPDQLAGCEQRGRKRRADAAAEESEVDERAALKKAVTDAADQCLACAICMDAMVAPHALGCGHMFCGECLANWTQRGRTTCPECRGEISNPPTHCRQVERAIETLRAATEFEEPPQAREHRQHRRAVWEAMRRNAAWAWQTAFDCHDDVPIAHLLALRHATISVTAALLRAIEPAAGGAQA